jgi:hypothetical protein
MEKSNLVPYCGIDKLRKGQKEGNIKECVDQKQIRLYGLNQVDKKYVDSIRKMKKGKLSRDKLIIMQLGLKGRLKNLENKYNDKKTSEAEKKKINEEYKKTYMELQRINKLLQEFEKPIEKTKEVKRKELKLPKEKKIGEMTQKEYIKTLASIDKKIMKMPKKKLAKIIKEEIENVTEGGCLMCEVCGSGTEMHHKKCKCEHCMCGGQVLGAEAINSDTYKFGGKFKQLQNPFNEVALNQIPSPYKRQGTNYKYFYNI